MLTCRAAAPLAAQGDMGEHREPHYSRGIRQRVYAAAQKHNWHERYRVMIGGYGDVHGTYSELLARSTFCLVMPGALLGPDGWARLAGAGLPSCPAARLRS
jgi:hypothetical protein